MGVLPLSQNKNKASLGERKVKKMWAKQAKAGDKIVCIEDSPYANVLERVGDYRVSTFGENPLVFGKVYTIVDVIPISDLVDIDDDDILFSLEEVPNLFSYTLFKPVERDRTTKEVEKLKKLGQDTYTREKING